MDGTYGFVYVGYVGLGIGALTIKDGVLTGADSGGCSYTGTASVDGSTGEIVFDFVQTAPAGVELVQNVMSLPWPSDRPGTIRLPRDFDGKPISVFLPPGEITVTFKRVPDDFAKYANGFSVIPMSGF